MACGDAPHPYVGFTHFILFAFFRMPESVPIAPTFPGRRHGLPRNEAEPAAVLRSDTRRWLVCSSRGCRRPCRRRGLKTICVTGGGSVVAEPVWKHPLAGLLGIERARGNWVAGVASSIRSQKCVLRIRLVRLIHALAP